MESALPIELLKLVFLQLPHRDLLETRFVCRRWSLVASEIVFQSSCLTLRNYERVREMIDHCKNTANASLPIKSFDVSLTLRNHIDMELGLVADIAPYLNNVQSASFDMWFDDSCLNDQHWSNIMQMVRLPKLRQLKLIQSPHTFNRQLSISVHTIVSSMSTALRKIDLTILTSDMDLGVIFTLVDRASQLETIGLKFASNSVGGQPLRDFMVAPHVHRTQCLHVAELRLFMPGNSDALDFAGLLSFVCFYLPRLVSLDFAIGFFSVHPNTFSLDRHIPPLPQLHLEFPERLILDLFKFQPPAASLVLPPASWRSTTRLVKELSVYAESAVLSDVLSSLNCSNVTTIIIKQMDNNGPLSFAPSPMLELTTVRLRKALLPQFDLQLRSFCPSLAQLTKLDLESCTLSNPGALERTLAQMTGLQVLALQMVHFTSPAVDPPSVSLENPWIPLLHSLFVHLQTQPEPSLQWIALPLSLTRIHIIEHFAFPGPTGVYFFLQDVNQAHGSPVQIWLHGLKDGWYYESPDEEDDDGMVMEGDSPMSDGDIQALFVRLIKCKRRLDAGARMKLPRNPPTFAEIALLCLCKLKNAYIYTCPSAHHWGFASYD
ncbi:hypothetical protein BC940DRAFT_365982, partial [Gongronella butleri]